MSEKDVLDPDLRLRFAWRTATTLPDDPLAPPAPAEAPSRARAAAEAEAEGEARESSAEACYELARRVARVWEMTPRRRQAAATHHLLARLEPTTVGFKGMGKHPVEVMRLWRLGVRHGKGLSKASRRVLWRMPIMLDSPETVELLVEVVESKGDALADRLEEMGLPKDVALYRPTLGARLARVVEHGKTWTARRRAVRWVARVDRRAAVDVLRRVIRAPLLPLRSCALDALREMRPMALAEEDVAWLLDDALPHPLPPGTGQDKGNAPAEYERALLEAVRACPPPEGWRPLEALAGGGGVPMGFLRDGLGADWALGALATAWPDRAAPRIDRALASSMPHRRLGAIEAAALLPEALARPRLLDAATLPNHAAAERAKERWFERFGEACPVAPLAGVPVDPLDGAPSDALLARLSVLRGASAEAAGKILTAALAEAPSREALVLLLYSLRDVGAAHRHAELEGFSDAHFVVQLTDGLKIWASEILRRFGAPAFDGLFALAAREAQAGVHDGWLDALASLARKGPFDEAQRARLRDLAAGLLGHSRRRVAVAACEVLEAVGTPASSVERLWSIVLDPPAPEDADYVRGDTRMALFALTATVEMPEVDARMVFEADAAFQRGDWELLGDLVEAGGRRGLAGVLDVAARVLARVERDPAVMSIADYCTVTLMRAGRIGKKWILTALERPSSPRFTVATKQVDAHAGRSITRALKQALDDRSRDGCAAVDAALALLMVGVLAVDDPRLDGILERAPDAMRLELVRALLQDGAPLASVRRHCATLLLSRDKRIAGEMFGLLEGFQRGADLWDLMESVMPLGPVDAVRESIEHYLGAPSEAEMYWRDIEDDDGPTPWG